MACWHGTRAHLKRCLRQSCCRHCNHSAKLFRFLCSVAILHLALTSLVTKMCHLLLPTLHVDPALLLLVFVCRVFVNFADSLISVMCFDAIGATGTDETSTMYARTCTYPGLYVQLSIYTPIYIDIYKYILFSIYIHT